MLGLVKIDGVICRLGKNYIQTAMLPRKKSSTFGGARLTKQQDDTKFFFCIDSLFTPIHGGSHSIQGKHLKWYNFHQFAHC